MPIGTCDGVSVPSRDHCQGKVDVGANGLIFIQLPLTNTSLNYSKMCHTKEDMSLVSHAASTAVSPFPLSVSHSTPLAGLVILGTRVESNESRENNQTQQAVEIKNSHIPLSYTTYHTTLKNNQKVVYTTQIPVNVNSCLCGIYALSGR